MQWSTSGLIDRAIARLRLATIRTMVPPFSPDMPPLIALKNNCVQVGLYGRYQRINKLPMSIYRRIQFPPKIQPYRDSSLISKDSRGKAFDWLIVNSLS